MRTWIVLLAGLFTTPALAASFAPDLAHTSVYFGASHFDRSTMRGRFDKIDGAINFDEATSQGGFDFTVDADSINTRLRVLDGVLKSEQFLDAAQFPVIRLRSDRFVVEGGKLAAIEAQLTLHGVTQPVRLEVRRFSCGDDKMPGSTRHVCGGDFHLAIARSAFGMTRFLPDVGDRVDIDISVEATPQ
ncbi:YceI family protein [Ralstonia pickettii]|jgi:polyisoprenoid-binding protein YceI|uniref:YceI family protein n=1 Tax=Ralstonia pickettii TaxID=329 RepID=UPI0015FB63CE|nr:YceI family protein [Ralstonia pickettii]MBB0025326.1 polyisoprenoid-binding protein [Ralstonia pickettii]MBB0036114.1 polyisoprenoid-binding protein [Ralstonia pickettii]MBB0098654.1 polyisoprenoid-binding protein [Ralstonia pickettii]MBB0108287.1 polyisoprenoid-binding protein [Ralstonia pickettii]MBB0129428.1 polyisoprenoid-binding protein [Ralstonia pickettii]